MADPINTNGWSQYEKLVMEKLNRLQDIQDQHTQKLESLAISHATMKAEASRDAKWISGIGSAIAVAISAGVHFVFKN